MRVFILLRESLHAELGRSKQGEAYDGHWYNVTLGRDAGYEDMVAARAALRFTPGNWTIDASLGHSRQRDEGNQGACWPDPQGPSVFANFIGDRGQVKIHASCNAARALGDHVSTTEMFTYSNTDVSTAFLTAVWDSDGPLGNLANATITTNLSYRNMNEAFLSDSDTSAWPLFYIGVDTDGLGTLSETKNLEVLFEADVNERLDFIVGTWIFDHYTDDPQGPNCKHYFDENYDPAQDPPGVTCPEDRERNGAYIAFFPTAPFQPFGPRPGLINGGVWEDSVAFFGHMTYALNDQWDLEFGIRNTEDERDWFNVETRTANNRPSPDGTTFGTYDVIMNNDTLYTNGWYGDRSDTYSDTNLRLSMTRSLDGIGSVETGMVYFLISEGYLTGGFNSEIPNNIPEIQVLQPVAPEYVTNYEVGFKGTMADGRLRLNTSVFFMDYTDKQAPVTLDNSDSRYGTGSGDTISLIQNAADAKIYGLEVEMAALPWDGGSLRLDLGYLNNEYSDFESFDPDAGANVDLSTTSISDLSPDWTLNASIEHTFMLANGASLTPVLGMYWQSEYDWAPPAVPGADPHKGACIQDAYSKFRGRLTYEPVAGNYAVSLFGSNISDALIHSNCGYTFGVAHTRWEAPAVWGLEFNADWGD